MNLKQLYLTKNDCYKAGRTITPKGIMVHSTGANNPNLKRYVGPDDGLLGNNSSSNHWNRTGTGACVHAFIGKLADGNIATYQTLPWNMRGWHAGADANNTHISFEICEDGLSDATYFGKIYQEAVELCAYLCNKYGLNPTADGVLICHSEGYKRGIASNHADVMHWFPKHGKSMDTFRAAVKAAMGGSASTAVVENTSNSTSTSYPTIKKGSTGAAVVTAQTLLNAKGANLTEDGNFGALTDTATKAFQTANGLTVDGAIGAKTWAALQSSSSKSIGTTAASGTARATLKKGSTGADVKTLQTRLKSLGYYTGTVDGDFGAKTLAAVKAFQKAKGLTVDGVVGAKTWAALGV